MENYFKGFVVWVFFCFFQMMVLPYLQGKMKNFGLSLEGSQSLNSGEWICLPMLFLKNINICIKSVVAGVEGLIVNIIFKALCH